jgi:nicotinamide-nucleotide amidase
VCPPLDAELAKQMTAEIVSVGTELLLGQIVDTHAPLMAQILADCGIACLRRQTVGDNIDRATEAIRTALNRAEIVIAIGGLGPTQDDITREAISAAIGDPLELDNGYEKQLRDLFAARRFAWVDSNLRQAMRPACATFIDNPNGTAPGLHCIKDGKTVFALPGPRSEFNPMATGAVRDALERMHGGYVIHSRTLRICGMGESLVEERVRHLMQGNNPSVAPYAHPSEVHLRLTARASNRHEADLLIDPVEQEIRDVLGTAIYGVDSTTLEQSVIRMLIDRKASVAVAESITGGWLGSRLTSVSGSGKAFCGGIISYDLGAKENLLDVSPSTLEEFGPVSAQTASEMAAGVREKLGADYGISLTGNAGPTADVDGKPVGLVYIGLASPDSIEVVEHQLRGAREDIRQRATQLALIQMRNALLRQTPAHLPS